MCSETTPNGQAKPCSKSTATKLVEINLAALTRVEYCEVIEVPADMTEGELDDLVEQRYRDVDGGDFWDDPDFWEQGDSCRWEHPHPEQKATHRLRRDALGRIVVEKIGEIEEGGHE